MRNNVLVTGAAGQLGQDVMAELLDRGRHPIAAVRCGKTVENSGSPWVELDITKRADVMRVIGDLCPNAVIHCAAWTAVDSAENHIVECRSVNVDGTRNIEEACKAVGCKL